MSLIRTILSIIGMIVVFSIVAEYLIMPIYTRQNQNRIMIDIKNKHLDDAINILKSENYKYEVSDTLLFKGFIKPKEVGSFGILINIIESNDRKTIEDEKIVKFENLIFLLLYHK